VTSGVLTDDFCTDIANMLHENASVESLLPGRYALTGSENIELITALQHNTKLKTLLLKTM
jgi:hypothetical protein